MIEMRKSSNRKKSPRFSDDSKLSSFPKKRKTVSDKRTRKSSVRPSPSYVIKRKKFSGAKNSQRVPTPASSPESLMKKESGDHKKLKKAFPFKHVEKDSSTKDSSSDNDSAPEEITFNLGQEEALLSMKAVAKQIQEHKKKIKKQRSDIHERNILQKEAKRKKGEVLESKKLPEDMLRLVADLPEKLGTKEMSVSKPHKEKFNEDGIVSDNADVNLSTSENEDGFISSCGPTEFKVRVLDKEIRKPQLIPDEVANFRQRVLQGDRIKRESTQQNQAYRIKQAAAGKLQHSESFFKVR